MKAANLSNDDYQMPKRPSRRSFITNREVDNPNILSELAFLSQKLHTPKRTQLPRHNVLRFLNAFLLLINVAENLIKGEYLPGIETAAFDLIQTFF